MDAVVTVSGPRKRYGAPVAVDDVSFDVAGGEIFGLLAVHDPFVTPKAVMGLPGGYATVAP